MGETIPSPEDWVAAQVARDEGRGGTQGLTLRNTDRPVVSVANHDWKTGAHHKTPVMRVADGPNYIIVASNGGAADNPPWMHNLTANPDVTVQDEAKIYPMRVHEVVDSFARDRIWPLALDAFPQYQQYLDRAAQTGRVIPIFIAEPVESAQNEVTE